MSKLEDVILRGTRAGQPAANTVAVGTLYFVTDETTTERSDGTNWQTFADAGVAPGLVLLEQHTASTSSSLDFTTGITSTYDEYLVEVVNLVPATDGVDAWFRVSTDGGSTYKSGGSDYSWNAIRVTTSASAINGSAGDSKINFSGQSVDNSSTTGGYSATFRIMNPLSGARNTRMYGQGTGFDGGGIRVEIFSGAYLATTAVNAFRILFSSGNISTGTVRLYGLAK